MQRVLNELQQNGTRLPNTIMLFNGEDLPICHRLHGCKVPVFSLFKRIDVRGLRRGQGSDVGTAVTGQDRFPDREILLPNFSQNWDSLRFYPWEHKRNVALFRASLQVEGVVA